MGIKNYQLDLTDRLDANNYPDEGLTVITLWHVLEHVHELNKTIEIMKSKLAKNGTMIIAVPNCDSLDAKTYGKYWAAYDVPRHLYHFTPKTIQQLFSKHGFKMQRMLPMNFDSFYVSLLSEKYQKEGLGIRDKGLGKLFWGFWNGLKSNLNAMKNEGTCSSQIYIFKKE